MLFESGVNVPVDWRQLCAAIDGTEAPVQDPILMIAVFVDQGNGLVVRVLVQNLKRLVVPDVL